MQGRPRHDIDISRALPLQQNLGTHPTSYPTCLACSPSDHQTVRPSGPTRMQITIGGKAPSPAKHSRSRQRWQCLDHPDTDSLTIYRGAVPRLGTQPHLAHLQPAATIWVCTSRCLNFEQAWPARPSFCLHSTWLSWLSWLLLTLAGLSSVTLHRQHWVAPWQISGRRFRWCLCGTAGTENPRGSWWWWGAEIREPHHQQKPKSHHCLPA